MKSGGFGKGQGKHTNHGFKGGGGFSKMKKDCDMKDMKSEKKKSDKKKKK